VPSSWGKLVLTVEAEKKKSVKKKKKTHFFESDLKGAQNLSYGVVPHELIASAEFISCTPSITPNQHKQSFFEFLNQKNKLIIKCVVFQLVCNKHQTKRIQWKISPRP